MEAKKQREFKDSDIAIIGMQCRFPGAGSVSEFWDNLRKGVESSTFFSERELREAGISEEVLKRPTYIRANNIIPDVDLFDAAFFDIPAWEAEIIDPQQRVFLECAYSALESAGYSPDTYPGLIGVYAGIGMNTYILKNLAQLYQTSNSIEHYQLMLANDKDFLCTRLSYKLNLKGPSLTVTTACSTSLVAVHLSCLSLLAGECDIAISGAVSIRFPLVTGYEYQEGMIFSPDGHCRAFDAQAGGTILGDGAGVVVLKRLQDAMEDGDTVHAIIKGSAINNDGAIKTGYTAPSVSGQARVIGDALDVAGVEPESVTYVETHGTGTKLGDPIEFAGLCKAFGEKTDKRGFCAIGSVKTNLGHLDVAAGMAGLIKTTLMLKHKSLVPSLHYHAPNPEIDFSTSPFFVNTEFRSWESPGASLRAGVSSFGIGGTNAHVVLEEGVESTAIEGGAGPQLLILSAKTESARDAMTTNLANYLKRNKEASLPSVAYTLAVGRNTYAYRCYAVGHATRDTALSLALRDGDRYREGRVDPSQAAPVPVFELSGAPQLTPDLQDSLYRGNSIFREQLDEHLEHWEAEQGTSFEAPVAQAIYLYALAQMWQAYGVAPAAVVAGASHMQVAAAIAGAFPIAVAVDLLRALLAQDHGAVRGILASAEVSSTAVPLLSADSGAWVTVHDLAQPQFWIGQFSTAPGRGSRELLNSLPQHHILQIQLPQNGLVAAEAMLHQLGGLWVAGVALDWELVYPDGGRRIPLPTYPFEGKRYWVGQSTKKESPDEQVSTKLYQQLKSTAPAQRRDLIVAHLQQEVATIMGTKAADVDSNQRFVDLGMASLILIGMAARLGLELDYGIPASMFHKYPTISAFADMLVDTVPIPYRPMEQEPGGASDLPPATETVTADLSH